MHVSFLLSSAFDLRWSKTYKLAVLLHNITYKSLPSSSPSPITQETIQTKEKPTSQLSHPKLFTSTPLNPANMQTKTLLGLLSVAIAASARPNLVPRSTSAAPSCGSTQTLACCDSITTNGTGLGCIFSSEFFARPAFNLYLSLVLPFVSIYFSVMF